MSSWVTRTVLSGSSVNQNGTNSHTCTFTAATAGNLLVAVVAGGVTSTTPSGWTLVTSAVGYSGIYLFTKTASSGESSFSTTHNSSNYEIKGVVYEFPAGTSVVGSNSATGQSYGPTATGPSVSSLTGTYSRFSARSYAMDNTNSTWDVDWTLPFVEDYDTFVPNSGSTDGVSLTIAYDDAQTASSFNPSATKTQTNVSIPSGEGISFALYIPAWRQRTVLSGSSINANGTTSHTCTFTAATSGNFLVAIVAGAVTFTTPGGWTLLTYSVGNGGLYVFTKTASSSESSFSTTHNASNYPIKGVVYEFVTGTSAIGSNSTTGMTETATGPQVSSLTGTYTRFSARGWVMANTNSSSSTVWTLPSVEDYDDYAPDGGASNDGIALTIAYDDNSTGSSFNPSSTMTATNTGGSGEGVSFALNVASDPPLISWTI